MKTNLRFEQLEKREMMSCDAVQILDVQGPGDVGFDRAGHNNDLINCIVSGFDEYESDPPASSPDHDFEFDYCCLDDNGTGFPTGGTNIEQDPLFIDADWNLDSESPCVGAPVINWIPNKDFDGDTRGGTEWDMGAQLIQP